MPAAANGLVCSLLLVAVVVVNGFAGTAKDQAALQALGSSGLPEAVALFPLTGNFTGYGNVSNSQFDGMGYNFMWAQDADAGSVLQCSKDNASRIELPAVPYGTQGPWAINLWFKPSNESGNEFQYLYSHNSTQFSNYTAHPYAANQIRLYFAETSHLAYGIIRSIVKDSTDTANRGSYMDSDDRVAASYESTTDSPPHWAQHFLADGLWHMITLTTLSNNAAGLQGFSMYLDGQLMASQTAAQLLIDQNGSVFSGNDGGRPMQLDGNIVLCDHSDIDFMGRGYNGALSHLSIYDNALNTTQVFALLHQGVNGSQVGSLATAAPNSSVVRAQGVVQAWPQLPVGAAEGSPLTPQQTALATVPSPAAFFPLSDGSLMSDPLLSEGAMEAGGSVNATFVEDPDTFGRTLQCNKDVGSIAWLLPVPYYAALNSGQVSFTINMWFKAGNTTGQAYQYLFSHMGNPDGSEWGPNQVAIYFPEQQQPRYGVVRAVIDDTPNEDSNVTAAQQVFLDSDSLVSDNVAPVTSSQPNRMADGNWHMVTVNTHADLTKGFMMYLDGLEVGNMLQGNETGSSGTVTTTGGGSMNLTSSITLCQRADAEPDRGFDGRLSSLSIWTSVLDPANISALFAYGLEDVSYMGNTTVSLQPFLAPQEYVPEPAPAPEGLSAIPNEQTSGGAIAGLVVGVVAACALTSVLGLLLFRRRSGSAGKFETFQDDTGAFPGSPPGTLAGEPGAQILWTQDSSTELLPSKFAMPA